MKIIIELVKVVLDFIFCLDNDTFAHHNILNKIYHCVMGIAFIIVSTIFILCCIIFFDLLHQGNYDTAVKLLIVIILILISIYVLFIKPFLKSWKSRKK